MSYDKLVLTMHTYLHVCTMSLIREPFQNDYCCTGRYTLVHNKTRVYRQPRADPGADPGGVMGTHLKLQLKPSFEVKQLRLLP